MYYYFEKYYKPIIFAILNLGGLVLLENLRFTNLNYFWSFSVIYLLVIALFLYVDKVNRSSVTTRPVIFDRYSHVANIAQHFLLPIWLTTSMVVLLYVNINRNLELAYILGASISLCFCYINIKSYYDNNYLIERRTHLIYDFIKMFLFIINANIILHLYYSGVLNVSLLYLSMMAVTFYLIFLIAFRADYDIKRTCLAVLIGCVLMVLMLFWCISILNLGFVYTNIFVAILFYIITAFIHHELEGTLTMTIMSEYLIWVLFMITILWGLS